MNKTKQRRFRALASGTVMAMAVLAALGSASPDYTNYGTGGYQSQAAAVPQTPAQFSASAACQIGVQFRELSDIERQYLQRVDGVYVMQVVPGGRAALAGVAANDILLAIDSAGVSNMTQATSRLHDCLPGQRMNLRILRGGAEYQATVTF